MATYVHAQSNPSAATSTTLYTNPGGVTTVLSGVTVANRSNVGTTFRVSIDPAAAGDSNEDYYAYDMPIGGNESVVVAQGAIVPSTGLVRVYATLATLSFQGDGVEI